MSVHRRRTKGGTTWRVQWRDESGRQRSRTFSLKRDADAWDAKVKLAKRQGELAALDGGKQRFREFVAEWQELYAIPHLAPRTLALYDDLLRRYLLPKIGDASLRQLTTERLQRMSSELSQDGVPAPTLRKTLMLLQGILERAAEWGRIQSNPARYVRKPRQTAARRPDALSPRQIESVRSQLLTKGRLRDATLVSVLAYAGLRPGEALALRWGDIGKGTISVDKALSLGEVRTTKTRRARTVRMLKPLAQDLARFKLASGRPPDDSLVFPTPSGDPWNDTDFRNWRRRHFRTAVEAAGLSRSTRPYDLRHSFASLLLAEQTNPAAVAAQLGHTLQVLFSTYAHVIEELRGAGRVDPAKEIRTARQNVTVAGKLPRAASASKQSS